MKFAWTFPYPSRRSPVLARNVVATSQPLAAQAGLQMLVRGGNAVDAALAAAITLTVVEPTSNGIGSDAFALVWDGRELHGFNGSGRAPRALSPDRYAGMKQMPQLGWDVVTVPGAVDAWASLAPVRPPPLCRPLRARNPLCIGRIHRFTHHSSQLVRRPGTVPRVPQSAATFLIDGRAPLAGEHFQPRHMAGTLSRIAESEGESFYRGELAARIVSFAKDSGGAMASEDLAEHHSEWVKPISQDWHGVVLNEIPPNGQGLTVLVALGILNHLHIDRYPVDSADSLHLQIEAMKTAFAVAKRHIADPAWMTLRPADLLDPAFLEDRAHMIRMDRALSPASAIPQDGGTVYLTAADQEGMMVSYIQSNYKGFGSGIVVPGTGISIQNRGLGFTLEEGHPNRVAGGKRPFHTIIPGFVMRDNRPLMSFGVMGAHMQAQGHLQMMIRIIACGQNPQAAVDAPRWYLSEDSLLSMEPGFGPAVRQELQHRGHRLAPDAPTSLFGGGQLIYCLPKGYCAASDPRKDGQAVGY